MPPNSSDRTPLLGEVDESHTRRGTLSRARARLSQIEHASSLSIRDIVLMLACLALVILGLCILIRYDDRRILQEICITRDCVKTASRLLSALDESVDPCDDFYAFATGGWQKSHTIPTNKSEVSVFDDVSLEVERIVHDLATRPSTRSCQAVTRTISRSFTHGTRHAWMLMHRTHEGHNHLWQWCMN